MIGRAYILSIALAACRPEADAVRSPPVASGARPVSPQLVRALSILATERAPSPDELAALVRRIDGGELTLDGFIESLVADDDSVARVTPLVVLRKLLSENPYGAPSSFVLAHDDGPGGRTYYLYKPCAPATAVAVHPWWDLDAEVRVCPDSYLPEQWTQKRPKGEPEISCLSENAAYQEDGGRCGCGPNLIRCFRDDEARQAVVESLRSELSGTVAYVTRHDLPIETIFTSNESWRDRNAELIRRTHVAEWRRDGHPDVTLRDLAGWADGGQWAARRDFSPGQNAGILTSPALVFFMPDRRQRMTYIYDVTWCAEADSFGATPEALLAIKSADIQIQSAGWRDLAARPLCTNCHARLDYGLQFFWGFPNANLASYFVPELQQTGSGPLYSRDIDDPRGVAELNPHGFAKLAVAQPEFRRCMARDFAEWALGNRTTAADIAAVEQVIRPGVTTPRELLLAALRLVARRWGDQPPPATASSSRPPAASVGVTITGELRRQLENHCLDCHDRDPARIDLSPRELDRKTIASMLDEVADGRMPADGALTPEAREAFIDAFVASAWSGPDAIAARTLYAGRMTALPVFAPAVMFDLVHRDIGSHEPARWRLLESNVRSGAQQLTPGLAATFGLEAIHACREARSDRTAFQHCIDDAVRVDNLALPGGK
jgi:hypothetical protein